MTEITITQRALQCIDTIADRDERIKTLKDAIAAFDPEKYGESIKMMKNALKKMEGE